MEAQPEMSKGYTIEFDDGAEDYRMVVLRRTGHGHRCGYVSVPKDHPFFGKPYCHEIKFDCNNAKVNPTDPIGTLLAAHKASKDDTKMEISYASGVHGGITYGCRSDGYPVETKDKWWFGFDAGHAGDDFDGGRPLDYMKDECEKLKQFFLAHRSQK